MAKIAFLFPGQGAQKVGMGLEIFKNFVVAIEIFEEADNALGFSLSKMCFDGPDEDLRLTKNTQPALLTVSVAVMRAALPALNITPVCAAGHSLGEYGALVAAGVISFADAVRTVRARGEFMQEAVPVGQGSMAAVMGLDRDKIIEICASVSASDGLVQAVNFNMPGQIVIAGTTAGVNAACEQLKSAGARRALVLPVSAPFHSSLMQPAAQRLKITLDSVRFSDARCPIICNVDAQQESSGTKLRDNLVVQAAAPVYWEDSIRAMQVMGVDTTIEFGSGPLSGFVKKIAPEIATYAIEDVASMEKVLAVL